MVSIGIWYIAVGNVGELGEGTEREGFEPNKSLHSSSNATPWTARPTNNGANLVAGARKAAYSKPNNIGFPIPIYLSMWGSLPLDMQYSWVYPRIHLGINSSKRSTNILGRLWHCTPFGSVPSGGEGAWIGIKRGGARSSNCMQKKVQGSIYSILRQTITWTIHRTHELD